MKGDLTAAFEKKGKKLLESLIQIEFIPLRMENKLLFMGELYCLIEMLVI